MGLSEYRVQRLQVIEMLGASFNSSTNCTDNTDQPKMYITGNVGYYATRFYKNFKYDPKLHRKKMRVKSIKNNT